MDVTPEKLNQLEKTFGTNVKRRRQELGLTQEALSDRTGIPRPDISDLERGSRSPNLATIARLAEGLAIPPSQLLSTEVFASI